MRKVYSLPPGFSPSFSYCLSFTLLYLMSFHLYSLALSDVSVVPGKLCIEKCHFGECAQLGPQAVLPEENILALPKENILLSFPFFLICPLYFFFFPMHRWMVKTGKVRDPSVLAMNSFWLFSSLFPHLYPWVRRLGCENFPGGVVFSLQGGWVTLYMWQAHGCAFCLCMGLDVDWQGTNSNFILYTQSSAKLHASPGGKAWSEGLEKLGVSEWVLIFNFALIHLRGREGRLWVVQSLWGCKWHSESIPSFLIAVPSSNGTRGPHRKLWSFST